MPLLVTTLLREQLGLGYVSTMEVSPDGRTVYFGRYYSYEHDRMNLGVISLDANGQRSGDIRYFSDCDITKYPLALDSRSSVIKIVIDSNAQKLYLIAYELLASPSVYPQKYYLTIHSLQDGIPNQLERS